MKYNTVYYLVDSFRQYWRLVKFKSDWRKKNGHNLTEANNIWPINKVEVGKYTYGQLNCHFFGTERDKKRRGDLSESVGNRC